MGIGYWVLGNGGFGIVYLDFDRALDREVADKVCMPSSLVGRDGSMAVLLSQTHAKSFTLGLRSFVNEARLLARFDQPSLVKVHRYWEANNTAYMAMPNYIGNNLYALCRRMALAPDEAWLRSLLKPLLGAFERFHGEAVCHRDNSPDNLTLQLDARPVLLESFLQCIDWMLQPRPAGQPPHVAALRARLANLPPAPAPVVAAAAAADGEAWARTQWLGESASRNALTVLDPSLTPVTVLAPPAPDTRPSLLMPLDGAGEGGKADATVVMPHGGPRPTPTATAAATAAATSPLPLPVPVPVPVAVAGAATIGPAAAAAVTAAVAVVGPLTRP